MQYETTQLLYSLRSNQCLAWLDFMASSIAVTEMLKTAALTSQLQISLEIKLTPPSLSVFAESDGFAPLPIPTTAIPDAPSTQNRFMEEASVCPKPQWSFYWTSLKLRYGNKLIFVFSS